MHRNITSSAFAFAILLAVGQQLSAAPSKDQPADAASASAPVDFFKAMNDGDADVTFIAKNDHDARLIIKNNTDKPLKLKMPEAFAGVPVAAQIGGGGMGGGGRGGGGMGGGGGGQQSVGGGMGGGGMGGGGMGGGGGMFSVPPEETVKVNVAVVCLEHGKRDPSSSRPYKIVPAEGQIDRPAVVELMKAFGRGELKHEAVQAAAWHLNNDMSWNELASKTQGTKRTPSRKPYFSADAIRVGMAYANEASRLASVNADEYATKRQAALEAAEKSSEEISTIDDSVVPESIKTDSKQSEAAEFQPEAETIP